jgi:hypothetical protein
MNPTDYLHRISTARSAKPAATSQDAYSQVDRMAKTTSGPFMTKASDGSSDARKEMAETAEVSEDRPL